MFSMNFGSQAIPATVTCFIACNGSSIDTTDLTRKHMSMAWGGSLAVHTRHHHLLAVHFLVQWTEFFTDNRGP